MRTSCWRCPTSTARSSAGRASTRIRSGRSSRSPPGEHRPVRLPRDPRRVGAGGDRKSTRLNSSHANISYAVFCLKKKKTKKNEKKTKKKKKKGKLNNTKNKKN